MQTFSNHLSQNQSMMISSTKTDFDLPDDCWESIFRFINDGNDDEDGNYLEHISLVSKQFLSITNRLLFSLSLNDPINLSSLHHLFHRFTNLTSLNLVCYQGDINVLLCEISYFSLNLTSLNVSNQPTIPTNGLRAFSKNITTLTSLTCSYIESIYGTDLFLIADCFPLLEELDLSYPLRHHGQNKLLNGIKTLSLSLFKLRNINLARHSYIDDQSLFQLFKNSNHLEEAIISYCHQITDVGLASALRERPTLRSLSFTNYFKSDNCTKLFTLIRNCPSLSKIRMTETNTGLEKSSVENSNSLMDFIACPELRSLHLPCNSLLRDECIKTFASIFPNLQLLDLSYCHGISEEGIFQVLRRCSNIKHLKLTNCSGVKLRGMNFEVPKLQVLNLSHTRVDDETLYVISKSFRGILQMLLEYCCDVTEKGVKHVVENCTQLREINLWGCYEVSSNFVSSLALSRPSLRKIIAPRHF